MPTTPRTIGTPTYLALGAAAAIVGLIPWIITGMRLPLQNLWATDTRPADMPLALLPFSQYYRRSSLRWSSLARRSPALSGGRRPRGIPGPGCGRSSAAWRSCR